MRKIALYCRVSTSNQEKEQTIETQLSKLRNAYKEDRIIKEYKDTISGSELSRPALNQLREDAKKGVFDVIAVYDLTRLARKLGYQIALIEEFEKQEIKIESLGQKIEDTPEGILSRNVLGAISEYERYQILKRCMDGKFAKARAGKIIGCVPPFGYDYVKDEKGGRFEINFKEAKGVKMLFKIFLEIHSVSGATRKFYELGYVGKKSKNPLRTGTIRYMLGNETYIGNWYYNKRYHVEAKRHIKEVRKNKKSGVAFRDKKEWIKVKVPAIIDKITFDKVQEVLKTRKGFPIRESKYPAICRSLIRCVKCGRSYIISQSASRIKKDGSRYRFISYRCPQRSRSNSWGNPPCYSRQMGFEKLDKYVWGYVSSLIKDTTRVKKAIRLLKEKRDNDTEFNQKVYDSLIVEKANFNKKKQRLINLYADENLTRKDLDEAISDINSQIENLNRQVKEAEKELVEINNLNQIESEVERLCLRYKKNIDNLTIKQKASVLRKWVKEINILSNGDIKIKVRIPLLKAEESKVIADTKADKPILSPVMTPVASAVLQDYTY